MALEQGCRQQQALNVYLSSVVVDCTFDDDAGNADMMRMFNIKLKVISPFQKSLT